MGRRHVTSSKHKPEVTVSDQADSLRQSGNEAKPPRNPWYFVLLTVVLIAPFAGILIMPGERILGHPSLDNPTAYYFYSFFVRQCWLQGTLPLWNPYLQLGLPFIGDGEGSVFHPLSVLLFFLRTGLAINWMIAISFVLTGQLFYGYLRALKLGRPAAWLGAVTWSFSSAMISRIYAGHLNILLTYISIPLIMMLWEKFRTDGGVRHLLGIAVAYGLMILAYYPQMLYIFSLFFLFYVLIQSGHAVMERPSVARSEGRAILQLGLAIMLGIGIGAIQLFPALDFVSHSFRQQATIEFCGVFSFPPENFLTLIAPGFFGTTYIDPATRYWGRNYYWEMWIYLGLLPLMMAAAGAWIAPRRRRIALLACAAIFLILGLGKNTFLFPTIYRCVPFFNVFRGSSKNMIVPLLCLVTLSAYGFDGLLGAADEFTQRRLRRIAAATGSLIFVVSCFLLVFLVRHGDAEGSNWQAFVNWVWNSGERMTEPVSGSVQQIMRQMAGLAASALGRGMLLTALGIGLIYLPRLAHWRRYLFSAAAVLVLADLLGIFLPMLKTFDLGITRCPLELDSKAADFPYIPRILKTANSNRPNIAMKSGYASAFGYTGNTLQRYNDFISYVQGESPAESHAESIYQKHTPLFRMLALDAVAVDPGTVPPDIKPIGTLGKQVLVPYDKINKKLPRAFLAAAPRYFSRPQDALAYVLSEGNDPLASPAIERKDGSIAPHPIEDTEAVRFVSFQPNRVELEVHTHWPRSLVLCSMYEKNWTAKINGERAQVYPANYIYRAIRVPAGTSRVVFKYRPAAFFWGVVVTSLSIVALLLVAIRTRTRPAPQIAAWPSRLACTLRAAAASVRLGRPSKLIILNTQ